MLNESFKKHIHREIANATVKILEKVNETYEFRGTGFFITEEGYLLTAYHCIKSIPLDDIFIETGFDGKFKAVLEEQKSLRDIQYDIAVLKVNHRPNHGLPLGTVSVQNVTDEVVAVGYPAGHKPENTQIGTYIGKISRFRTDNKIENNAIKGQGQSGGLIYHYATQRVIGLAVRGYKADVMLDTGLATRFEPLFYKWAELEIINAKMAKAWEEHIEQLHSLTHSQNNEQHTTNQKTDETSAISTIQIENGAEDSAEKNDVQSPTDFPDNDTFIKNIFLELPHYPVTLLLTQADWSEPPYHTVFKTLLAQAQMRYGKNKVLHIQPPANLTANIKSYFSRLGKRCGFSEVDDADSFEYALEECLEQTEQLFLLVSRFEQGSDSLREQLAGIIRSLSATAPQHFHDFHVILCGGEKLVDLKYKDGEMSLLNHAKVEYYPELSRPDVYVLFNYYFNGKSLNLDDTLVDKFLAISGAYPKLLKECLELKKRCPDLPLEEYPKKLSQCNCVYELFTPFAQEESVRQQVYEWLQQEELGKAEPYILNNLLRRLYWKNLLFERNINGEKRLCWRCEAMQIAGRNICGNRNQ